MAIAEMKKLNLVAMAYDKQAVLDALQRTNATEITFHKEFADTSVLPYNGAELEERIARLEATLQAISTEIDDYNKLNGVKEDVLKDGFDVSYQEFMSAGEKREEAEAVLDLAESILSYKNALRVALIKAEKEERQARIYKDLLQPFSRYSDTAHVRIRLGVIATQKAAAFFEYIEARGGCAEQLSVLGDETLVSFAFFKDQQKDIESGLADFSFTVCPYTGDETGKNVYDKKAAQIAAYKRDLQENAYAMYELKYKIRLLKVYCDYLYYALEKEKASEKIRATEYTLLLEAYVPSGCEERVKEELLAQTKAVYIEFTDPTEEDTPPTLMRNNAVIKNFETVTNMYSPPHSREIDPNTVMAFFYSLFMGFIMGDIGYGLIMSIGGWLVYKRCKRDGGMKRLAGVFAVGGLFAIVWGVLFNSLFGIFLPFIRTVMPNAQTDLWHFMGIAVPSVLVISLVLGVLQLCAGYLCKAALCFKRKDYAEAIFGGFAWAIFSIGVGFALVGLVEEAKMPQLASIGGIMAGTSLLIVVLTAGRKEKFFGKIVKGFGAVYGIINYASDILSYARVYGLMLSGAVIAQIISSYSVDFIASGNIGLIALAVVLMVVGHTFNIVIGLLGAYIHDARLQYVEFYGRFFEGEGELFSPLGSKHKYIYLLTPQKE